MIQRRLDKVSAGPSSKLLDDTADNLLSSYAVSLSLTCGKGGLVCYLWGVIWTIWSHTQTSSPFPSIHLSPCTASRPYHELGLWTGARRQQGLEAWWWWGADCQTGRAGFSRSLLLSALSVSVSVLTAAVGLSFPRGLRERREMWCCYSGARYGGVCLQWPCCMHVHPPPPTSSYFTWAKKLQAPGAA